MSFQRGGLLGYDGGRISFGIGNDFDQVALDLILVRGVDDDRCAGSFVVGVPLVIRRRLGKLADFADHEVLLLEAGRRRRLVRGVVDNGFDALDRASEVKMRSFPTAPIR